MKVAISVIRPFHSVLLANTILRDQHSVTLYTSATRKFFKGLSDQVKIRLMPAPLNIVNQITGTNFPREIMLRGESIYDAGVAAVMGAPEAFIGWATYSLYSGRAAKRRGGRYILDRACPHTDFQQQLLREESALTGATYEPHPDWFRERTLNEYAEADAIIVPSDYSGSTFPAALQHKIVKAPLIGRTTLAQAAPRKRNEIFTVGILGGEPRRKGYIYLLRAWKKLALPNARLLIRSSANFTEHPVLKQLIDEQPSIEVIRYVPNINEFYQRCDAFVLSSVDDGFGMALFEAMANAVPCIATRNCGASELVTDGQDGIVIDARSEDQIAAALLRLYENEEERVTLAANGRERALYISSGAGARMYEQAIHGMLANSRSSLQALPLSRGA